MITSINQTQSFDQLKWNEVTSKTKSLPEKVFDKYVFKKGDLIPEDLDLKGCIAISRDSNHKEILHWLFWIAQKIHTWLFGKANCDTSLCHGMVITGRNLDKSPNHLIIAHGVFDGIKTSCRDYLKDDDVTELVIYKPKDEGLRQLIVEHAGLTAKGVSDETDRKIKLASFSVLDMFGAMFKKYPKKATEVGMKRTAKVVADFLLGNQILNDKGQPRSLFCVAYMTSLLQGSMIIKGLSEEYKQQLIDNLKKDQSGKVDKEALVADIYHRFKNYDPEADQLSKAYWNYRFNQLDPRFTISCYAGEALDQISD